tara:strand:+ start:944 stop:1399 length:456 start_codon:yes stop_codon:yes gene_type:complete
MKKNTKIFLLFFFFLISCGYEPIYSSKNINFSIKEIIKKDNNLNNKFANSLRLFSNEKLPNQIKIKIESNKNVKIKSKDSKGNPNVYELVIYLKLTVEKNTNDETLIKNFERNINYNNSDDKFKLNQYQKELEDLLVNKITEDVLKYLSSL